MGSAGDPTGRAGAGAGVRLTVQQLLINQRVYQAALLRARALEQRLRRLTGGDMERSALGRGRLTPGLAPSATGPAPSSPPSRSTPQVPERNPSGAPLPPSRQLSLSVAQLRINQRIAQAAVRTSNDSVAQIERGLVNSGFADGSVGADALAPGVVTGP